MKAVKQRDEVTSVVSSLQVANDNKEQLNTIKECNHHGRNEEYTSNESKIQINNVKSHYNKERILSIKTSSAREDNNNSNSHLSVTELRDTTVQQPQSRFWQIIRPMKNNRNYSTFTNTTSINNMSSKNMYTHRGSSSGECPDCDGSSSSTCDTCHFDKHDHSCPLHDQQDFTYSSLNNLFRGRRNNLPLTRKGTISTQTSSVTESTEHFLVEPSANPQQGGSELIRLDQYHKWMYENHGGISLAALEFARQEGEARQRELLKQRVRRSAFVGAFVGGVFAIILLLLFPNLPDDYRHICDEIKESYRIRKELFETKNKQSQESVRSYDNLGSYLPPFFFSVQGYDTRQFHTSHNGTDKEKTLHMRQTDRTLLSSDSSSSSSSSKSASNSPLLVVAGKMTISGGPCNIAQFNLETGEWSLDERIQLSLYNSYSGGEVYSLLANYTINPSSTINPDDIYSGSTKQLQGSRSGTASETGKKQVGSGELIVVGAFDTTYRNSQVTYCSVGMWNGLQLSKVGEGLCNSALSKGMKITTASLAGPQDVYVAGSFQTQVWSGDRNEFVKIFNIAHFNAVEQVWLPLNVGQISCSWCTVTVLALAWDSKRRQLHIAGKFNAIDGRNVPAGLAIYDYDSGHLVAHPGGGLSMRNVSQDGVGTALQLDEGAGVLYVMGSFERLTQTYERCDGLAAYEIDSNRWTCLADAAHTVYPTGGGNMLLTPFGLMVAGKTTPSTTWHNAERPHTIALLKATLQTKSSQGETQSKGDYTSAYKAGGDSSTKASSTNETLDPTFDQERQQYHDFNWSWLPGFKGHDEPLHALTNGFGFYEGSVFIAGDNLVARWSYQPASKYPNQDGEGASTEPPENSPHVLKQNGTFPPYLFEDPGMEQDNEFDFMLEGQDPDTLLDNNVTRRKLVVVDSKSSNVYGSSSTPASKLIPVTEIYSADNVRGAIMAISQMMPEPPEDEEDDTSTPAHSGMQYNSVNVTIIVYCVTVGCVIGVLGAILCNRNISGALFQYKNQEKDFKGFSLDTLTYSAMENTSMMDAYQRAMKTRHVQHPNLLTIIDPQEIFLQRIIGEGTFGRVWSAKWRTASVAVKEFVFAQAAVAGKSSQQQQIVEEIIGEAGMMSILRHPNVLQLFGCSLTAQAIWIVSELCSLGSLRQLLDDNDRVLSVKLRLNLAVQVAEGMTYLHNQNPPIIHRDLKSHNIFVHETFTDVGEETSTASRRKDGSERMDSQSTIVARIGDWGSARASLSGSRTMTHGVGTACWLAPEVIKHARSSKFSDVYGYGIVLWELATREEVYQGLETTQIIAKVANENLRPPVPQDCPWKDVMVKCWAENPLDRLEFQEIDKQLNDLAKRLQELPSVSPSDESNPSSNESIESFRSNVQESM